MKKNLILTLCTAMLLIACGQKNTAEQTAQDETKTETANDYAHLNPAQDNGTVQMQEDLSGKVIMLTSDEFLAKVTDIDPEKGLRYKGKTPCIVDFYADWCNPCRQLAPVAARLAEKYKGQLIIYKVNVDKAQDICEALNISSIPTLLFLKPNTQPGMMVGAPAESELDEAIQEFLK
jgi:thioredoxin